MYIWKRKVLGNAAQGQFATDRATWRGRRVGSDSQNNPIAPLAGSVVTMNQNIDWEPMSAKVNATDVSEDGRSLKLMICAGGGFGEHYLGDARVGNLASTKSMELPAIKKIVNLQRKMTRMWKMVYEYVLKGKQDNTNQIENDKIIVKVNYPPLVRNSPEDALRDAQANDLMLANKTISRETVMEKNQDIDDPDIEKERIKQDQTETAELAISAQNMIDKNAQANYNQQGAEPDKEPNPDEEG